MKKRVIFVDDEPNVLQGLKRMLRTMRGEWEMVFADGGEAALAEMAKQPFDVVVSDMRMPGMDGAELLTRVMEDYPNAVRIVLSGQAEKEAMLRSIGPSHQYLSKPCDAETIKNTIGRACGLKDILNSDRLSFISQMKGLPSLPEIYFDLVEEINSEDPSITAVTKLIEKDMGMTAKILQLVNSAYFGVRKHISGTEMAIKLLGLDNVKSIVLFTNVFSEVDSAKAIEGFSASDLWQHCGAVGKIAQKIAKAENASEGDIENALTAGLLHDCGKLVFASCIGDKFGEAFALSQREKIPLSIAETEVIGASHEEAGAFLLALWGIPNPIIEAVAFHHFPQKCVDQSVSPLTAVHAANFIEHSCGNPQAETIDDKLDTQYLTNLGLIEKIEDWRKFVPKTED